MGNVYMLPVAGHLTEEQERACLEMLPSERVARLMQIGRKSDRQQALLAEGLLRRTCASIFGAKAVELPMAAGPHGKPYFPDLQGFHFNLTHTTGLVALAVSEHNVGVDAEHGARPFPAGAARRALTAGERRYVFGGPQAEIPRRFLIVWTQKEAYAKWDGRGLGAGFRAFDVTASPLRERLRSFVFKEWILAVCGEEGDVFSLAEVPLEPFLAGVWHPAI